jgi:hypothetical protein
MHLGNNAQMKRLALMLLAVSAWGQSNIFNNLGWTQLSGTKITNTALGGSQNVCPAIGASGSVAQDNTSPYDYQSACKGVIEAWSSGVVRDKAGSEALYIWGGGHGDYGGNEVYKLDLRATPPKMLRLTNPSQITSSVNATAPLKMPDGNPNIRHTYDGLAYLPLQDVMFDFGGGGVYPGAGVALDTWWFNFATWTSKDPVNGFNPLTSAPGQYSIRACSWDPSSRGMYCFDGFGTMLIYDPANNEYLPVSGGVFTGGTTADVNNPSSVIDTKRHVFYRISNGRVIKTDISAGFSSSLVLSDITASVDSSCSTLYSAPGPGLQYDPVIDKIVGYPQDSVNTVWIMDPVTLTCHSRTFPGGPPATGVTPQTGTFKRFSYISSLDVFVVVNGFNQDAWILNLTGVHGLGGSTITCLDLDGDGYGTGPGCLGPDADDQDATVHTWPQAKTKWSTFSNFIQRVGYTPTHVWYVAPASGTAACLANLATGEPTSSCSGNDGTGVEDDPAHPFATWAHIRGSVAAGHMVAMRDGYTDYVNLFNNGTVGKPIIFYSYPGELAVFDSTSINQYISLGGGSWFIIDGYKGQHGGCILGGDLSYNENPHSFHDNTIRHIEGTDCGQGIGPVAGMDRFVIEDSVFHDNNGVGEQAGVYTGCTYTAPCTDNVVRRVIAYNNNWDGIHINGNTDGNVVTQCISYANGIAGFSMQSGNSNGTYTSNLAFSNDTEGFVIYSYKNGDFDYAVTNATWTSGTATLTIGSHSLVTGDYMYIDAVSPSTYNCKLHGCAITGTTGTTVSYAIATNPGTYSSGGHIYVGSGDQTNNVVENSTFVTLTGATTYTPGLVVSAVNGPVIGDLGGNTYKNNIITNNSPNDVNNVFAPISFPNLQAGHNFLSSSTLDHNLAWDAGGGLPTLMQFTGTTGANGNAGYDTSGNPTNGGPPLVFTTGSLTNQTFSDPKFIAFNVSYTPSQFNFKLQGSSPAVHSGTAIPLVYDLLGGLYNFPPSQGAIEYGCSIAPKNMGGPFSVGNTPSTTFTAVNCGSNTLTWNSSGLPASLSGCSGTTGTTCTVSGTITAANGLYSVTISVTDGGANSSSITFPLQIGTGSCAITPTSIAPWTVGQAVSVQLVETGCTASLTWGSSGSLPTGVTLNTSSGLVSGTVGTAAGSPYSWTATYDTGSRAYTIVVNAAPSITTTSLPAGTVTVPYSQTLGASGGTTPLAWDTSSGVLPPGLTLSAAGVISGVPTTTTGSPFTATYRVTDANGITATKSLSITINANSSVNVFPLPTPVKR